MINKFMFIILVTQLYFSCGDPEVLSDLPACTQKVLIDEEQYVAAKSDQFEIVSVNLIDNCLNLEISSSGCDGSRWSASLLDQNAIAESSPEQRYVRLVLSNEEECDAIVQRAFQFEIADLQIQNDGRLILNIQDFDQSVIYEY